jgi:hypothetical protein
MVSKDRGFKKITLASDCLTVIKRVLARAQDHSITGTVVVDIKTLKAGFESCSFSFSNVVAHKLARSAESIICSFSVGVIPELIREELYNDVA